VRHDRAQVRAERQPPGGTGPVQVRGGDQGQTADQGDVAERGEPQRPARVSRYIVNQYTG
jgi:hypothetical protein